MFATPNGLFIAPKDLSEIAKTSTAKLGGFDGDIVTSFALGQRFEEASHGLFRIRRVSFHGGILPKTHPCYRRRRLPKNRVPKKPNREVNFGQFQGGEDARVVKPLAKTERRHGD